MFKQPLRYSEDIDLVQTQAEPIGPTVDAIREALAWLGKCNREQAGHSMHLVFRFAPEAEPQATLKLKVEINTREHSSLLGLRPISLRGARTTGTAAQAELLSFEPEELFGTKLRALLQRRKNRDLFDLHQGSCSSRWTPTRSSPASITTCAEGMPISRAEAEERMLKKLTRSLTEDIEPLLPAGVRFDEPIAIEAFNGGVAPAHRPAAGRCLAAERRGDRAIERGHRGLLQ